MTLLGIDLGTSNLKVATFTTTGELIDARVAPVVEHHNGTARWQDADAWWQRAVELVRSLSPEHIDGVSISGRANAGVFLDRSLEVISQPWGDLRHRAELERVREESPHLSTYGTALVSKMAWLREHQPHVYRRTRYAAYAKDFLFLRLTGVHKTDWSSGPDQPTWGDLDRDVHDRLPAPCLPWDVDTKLSASAARATGLRPGIPVAVGAHDGVCANVGVAATMPGTWALTLGTHAVVRAIVAESHAFRFYAMPPDRHVIGRTTLAAGRAIDWWCRTTGRDRSELLDVAEAVAAGAQGARFYPYLHGQIAPRLARDRRGRFIGMSDQHDAASLLRAVIEGVSFSIGACADALETATPRPDAIAVTGGGIRNPLWLRILADILARPLDVSDSAVEARGACVFLALGLGIYASLDEAAATMRVTERRVTPNAATMARYQSIRAEWEKAEADDIVTD